MIYKLLDNVPEDKAPEPAPVKTPPKAPAEPEKHREQTYKSMNDLEKSKSKPHSTNSEYGKLSHLKSIIFRR